MSQTSPKLRNVDKGESLFQFITNHWTSDNSIDRAIHRLCNLMRKMDAKKVIVESYEKHFQDDDIKKEIDEIKATIKHDIKYEIFRLTFITSEIAKLDDIEGVSDDAVLSSAIIINIGRIPKGCLINEKELPETLSYIFKAIVKEPTVDGQVLLNNYLHVCRLHKCDINWHPAKIKSFTVKGTYFCQQNRVTSVCAHACICMNVNNMPSTEKYVTSSRINEILGKSDWYNKGMNVLRIKEVFHKLGFITFYKNYFEDTATHFNDDVYLYLESRFPVLLIFVTKTSETHALSLIGHTLNTDLHKGEARLSYSPFYEIDELPKKYCKSSDWVDNLIVNDDNYGMFLCLPTDLLRKVTLPQYDPYFRAYASLAIIPNKKIKLRPIEAELFSVKTMQAFVKYLATYKSTDPVFVNIWVIRFLQGYVSDRAPILTRTLFVTKAEYKKHLEETEDSEKNKLKEDEISNILGHIPDEFWLTEFSMPDLYTTNKTKIIDVVYSCTHMLSPSLSEERLVHGIYKGCSLIRMPERSFANIASLGNKVIAIKPINNSIKSHSKLFTYDKSSKCNEW